MNFFACQLNIHTDLELCYVNLRPGLASEGTEHCHVKVTRPNYTYCDLGEELPHYSYGGIDKHAPGCASSNPVPGTLARGASLALGFSSLSCNLNLDI